MYFLLKFILYQIILNVLSGISHDILASLFEAIERTETREGSSYAINYVGRKRDGEREIKASLLIWSHYRYRITGTNYVKSMYR